MALTKKTTKELEEKVTKKEYLNDMENVWHTIDRIEDKIEEVMHSLEKVLGRMGL